MSVEGGRNGSLEGPLFASVLALEGAAADARARLLTWAPLVVLLHALVLWGVSQAERSPMLHAGGPRREDADRVLRLLSGARPPSGVTKASAPARPRPPAAPTHGAPPPSVATRAESTAVEPLTRASADAAPSAAPTTERPRPQTGADAAPSAAPATGKTLPQPSADAAPSAAPTTEVSPEAISDTTSPASALPPTGGLITASPGTAMAMSLSGAELDGVARAAVGGVVGSILGSGNVGLFEAPSVELTDAQREEWLLRYAEQIIDARFEFVRYPHQAAAAGIRGLVVVKVSVGAKGQLLHHELLGRCPHSVLCDAAMELVKNAAPFPPPPSELGRPVQLELPFNFHL